MYFFQISVPRDAGTCTRCPMECRLSHSTSPWQCRISIRREYDAKTNEPLLEIKEVPFAGPITDKSHVELNLRRAQLAVLNPGIPASKILQAGEEDLRNWSAQTVAKGASFSRDVVCVDLEGPELTDLAFIDLPGHFNFTSSKLCYRLFYTICRVDSKCGARCRPASRADGGLAPKRQLPHFGCSSDDR